MCPSIKQVYKLEKKVSAGSFGVVYHATKVNQVSLSDALKSGPVTRARRAKDLCGRLIEIPSQCYHAHEDSFPRELAIKFPLVCSACDACGDALFFNNTKVKCQDLGSAVPCCHMVEMIGASCNSANVLANEGEYFAKCFASNASGAKKLLDANPLYTAWEFARGEDLRHSEAKLSSDDKSEIVNQLFEARDVMARHRLMHGDLSLANTLWDSEKRCIRIIDFDFLQKIDPSNSKPRTATTKYISLFDANQAEFLRDPWLSPLDYKFNSGSSMKTIDLLESLSSSQRGLTKRADPNMRYYNSWLWAIKQLNFADAYRSKIRAGHWACRDTFALLVIANILLQEESHERIATEVAGFGAHLEANMGLYHVGEESAMLSSVSQTRQKSGNKFQFLWKRIRVSEKMIFSPVSGFWSLLKRFTRTRRL